jgi:hypothetical protein
MTQDADGSAPMLGSTLRALNPDDPSGPPITVRLPDEIASIVCRDCDSVVGGGDPAGVWFSKAIHRPCPFCGKGPPVVE